MKKAPIHGAFCVLLKTSDENKNLVVPTDGTAFYLIFIELVTADRLNICLFSKKRLFFIVFRYFP